MTFTRTRISFEVLSEEPIQDWMGLEDIAQECNFGSFVMADVERTDVSLSGKEMAEALTAAGSEPNFFDLTPNGEPRED